MSREFADANITKFIQLGIAAGDLRSGKTYSQIDFADLEEIEADMGIGKGGMIFNLDLKERIRHTFPPIDRCCHVNGRILKFDNIDDIDRIQCNITSNDFKNDYVDKRKPVILNGCQESWKARNWTFGNLLGRYVSKWPMSYYFNEKEDCFAGYLDGPKIFRMMRNGAFVKSMTHLPKSKLEQLNESEKEYLKLDLLNEYNFPQPFPKDVFEEMNIENDQAYIMFSTRETGTLFISIFEFLVNFSSLRSKKS